MRIILPGLFVLVLGLLATLFFSRLVRVEAEVVTHRAFQAKAIAIEDAVRDVMTAYKQILRAAGGLFDANLSVSRENWRVFVRSLMLNHDYPGAESIGYAKVLRAEEVSAFLAELRSAGLSDAEIHPQGGRPVYIPIKYIEPDEEGHRHAIGYDGFAEPVRRSAMERARDTGEASVTGKLALVRGDENSVPSVLMYFPLYDGGKIPPTVEERRANLRGYVFSAFRLSQFLTVSLSKQHPGWQDTVRLRIFDTSASQPENLLFDSASSSSPPAEVAPDCQQTVHTEWRELEIAGQQWSIEATSVPTPKDRCPPRISRLVLANGVLISTVMAGIVASLSCAHFRSEQAQKRLADEVAQRQRAQAEVEFTNRELIHRVKNTLAVVAAIATQTERYSSSLSEFSASFRDRLAALARVQDLLRPNPSKAVSLNALIRSVLAPYSADDGVRLLVAGPEIAVSSNEAVLLSLLFNELATNATKYGAWATSGGRVDVRWQIEVQEQADAIALKWIERGGLPVAAPPKTGFGMNVMKFTVERALSGSISAFFEPDGVRYAMCFPWNGSAAADVPRPV